MLKLGIFTLKIVHQAFRAKRNKQYENEGVENDSQSPKGTQYLREWHNDR
jgi:hypothetical protein